MTPTEEIYLHWNSKKQRGNRWKGHEELRSHMVTAIQKKLRQYGLETLKEAIDNYAMVVLDDRKFRKFYAWTLHQYLTRNKPNERKELQFYRWLPGEFYEEEYYSDDYKKKMQHKAGRERKRQDYKNQYSEFPTERLKEMKEDRYYRELVPIIEEIIAERERSPEIFTEA